MLSFYKLDTNKVTSYSNFVMNASQHLIKPKVFVRATNRQRLIAAGIFIAIFAFFSFFAVAGHYKVDMGRWLGYCSFKQKTGLPCPTCGMTTATLAFSQGQILRAFYIQPACALICTFMVIISIIALIVAVFGMYFRFLSHIFKDIKVRYIIFALIIITACGWAVTLARAAAGWNWLVWSSVKLLLVYCIHDWESIMLIVNYWKTSVISSISIFIFCKTSSSYISMNYNYFIRDMWVSLV